ncbi:hypothetical protein KR009_003136 [Drosophila setifemur]|nr:hypothetical protein KR009_003136 [Drosophila setifemur]
MQIWTLFLSIALIRNWGVADRGTISEVSDETFELLISGGHMPDNHRLSRHVVSIRTLHYVQYRGDNHFCSGTLVSSRVVLTAAHCLTDRYKASMNPRGIRVVFGHIDRLAAYTKEDSRRVNRIMVHPNFNRFKENDLALIRLSERVPSHNHNVRPIMLRKSADLTLGSSCVTLGWGQVYLHGPYSDELLYLDVIIRNHSLCNEHVQWYNSKDSICVEPDAEGEVCAGDMGGPLICRGALAGLIGGSLGCSGGKAMRFISYAAYRGWIDTNIRYLTRSGVGLNSIGLWIVLMTQIVLQIVLH